MGLGVSGAAGMPAAALVLAAEVVLPDWFFSPRMPGLG
ncbi:hypothetical protein Cagg_2058 [Chloroflexus aggregans DSM 9485]|uniref:Uncharacterized protein n=1 Tax=Chloroflexus aggregans (strain MD-66 / DSM 9485) TaxID=326427 RepID=B8GBX9_CHLAD|nr:hypothetical protein Cagg_2058 [Chloroflexus aggregans DSM 9485]